jgi:hypothetical protein
MNLPALEPSTTFFSKWYWRRDAWSSLDCTAIADENVRLLHLFLALSCGGPRIGVALRLYWVVPGVTAAIRHPITLGLARF